MNLKFVIVFIISFIVMFVTLSFVIFHEESKHIIAMVIHIDDEFITVRDQWSEIYIFNNEKFDVENGDVVIIEYDGVLNHDIAEQDVSILNCDVSFSVNDMNVDMLEWFDHEIFAQYYQKAYDTLKTLSLDEKIGQLLLVRYPEEGAEDILQQYRFGGYLLFEKDFKGKNQEEVQMMIGSLQDVSNIPLLIAVDEEGGKVVRVSSNSNLADSRFLSSQELYQSGGFDAIHDDTIEKSKLLSNLGINLNLAPVVDVSTNSSDYMYARSFGQDAEFTSLYSKTVIEASRGGSVSYTLKHFPGYGNNIDTHKSSSLDDRSFADIVQNDLPPFEAGIKAGAEAVMVSHNVVSDVDPDHPASLSASIHNLLRNRLSFSGIIITDDLDMGAVSSIKNSVVQSLLAGNDIIITGDYENSFEEIKSSIDDGLISESLIDWISLRVIAWKYYKGMF